MNIEKNNIKYEIDELKQELDILVKENVINQEEADYKFIIGVSFILHSSCEIDFSFDNEE